MLYMWQGVGRMNNLLMYMDVMCKSCASGKLNPCHSKQARIACYLQGLEEEE
jgi:hypothetical protein